MIKEGSFVLIGETGELVENAYMSSDHRIAQGSHFVNCQ
jgi:hypothetical protein